MKTRILVSALVITSVLAIGCSTKGNSEIKDAAAAVGGSMSKQVMPAPPEMGSDLVGELQSVDAPQNGRITNFTWKNSKGETIKLTDFAKGKVLFLNFWGTWCPPCRREIPDIIEVVKNNGGKEVVFVGVTLNERGNAKDVVSSFITKNGMNYINIVSGAKNTQEVAAAFGGIESVPTTFIFDKKGNVRQTIIGSNTKEVFAESLDKASK